MQTLLAPNAWQSGNQLCNSPEQLLWLNPDRGVFWGLHGRAKGRRQGCYLLYVSLEGRHTISMQNGKLAVQAQVTLVPPFAAHSIASHQPMICGLLFEAETVSPEGMAQLARRIAQDESAFVDRVGHALSQLRPSLSGVCLSTHEFDRLFTGQPLPALQLDSRIARITNHIKSQPTLSCSASDCASLVSLSESRILHLFSQQMGAPFRQFRSWKRARTFLHHLGRDDVRLIDLALDAGYPDSTYFSHSIRSTYGLTPTTIFSGTRGLKLQVNLPLH